jgi:dolichol-phosphate mannosyltransferase
MTGADDRRGEDRDSPVLSIVLATLNERANIAPLLGQLLALDLPLLEIIVVDDGSVDGTREYVQAVSQRETRVRLLWHDGPQTLTTAQLQGYLASSGKYVVVMDADLQHPPEIVPGIVRALDSGARLAIASRYVTMGGVEHRSTYRAVLSRGAEAMAKLALPAARGVSDPISGFFGFRAELARPLNPSTRGYKLLLFLLVLSQGNGVREIGYRFRPRTAGSSKIAHDFGFLGGFTAELLTAKRLDVWRKSGRSRSPALPPFPASGVEGMPRSRSSESQPAYTPGYPPP